MLELVFDGTLPVVADVLDPAIAALQERFAMDELPTPMAEGTTKH